MTLASIFTDHMVFQAEKPIYIFGSGKGKGKILFNDIDAYVESDADEWCVEFPAMKYGGPYEMKVIFENNMIILKDIYVGEVWLACGQSNIEMPLFCTEHGIDEAEHSQNDRIRFFTVPKRFEKNRVTYIKPFYLTLSEDKPWEICNEKSSLYFSAIGYYVAKELSKKLNAVIGIINCSWGGAPIEAFIDRKYFYNNIYLKPIIEEYDKMINTLNWHEYDKFMENDAKDMELRYLKASYDEVQYVKEIGAFAAAGHSKIKPESSKGVYYGPCMSECPGSKYDSMISRIIPFSVKGVIWYQGESNQWKGYSEKYITFMKNIREAFRDLKLKFYAVELPGYANSNGGAEAQKEDDRFVTEELKSNWAFFREEQQKATENDENNYLVTSMGLESLWDIHPIHKREISRRIANKILKHSYNFSIMADQPIFKTAEFNGSNVIVHFYNSKGLYCDYISQVKMYIADSRKILKKANLQIVDEKLILSSSEIKTPELVRYGFDNYYLGSHIFNEVGLPLAPFRTDKYKN